MTAHSIYSQHRKIWEQANGPIPVDSDGRTYEIHHINGDPTDDSLENLMCVSIQEHYNIHYEQGDYGAAFLIAGRMKTKPETIRETAKKAGKASARKLLQQGTHNFQTMLRDDEWKSKNFYKTEEGKVVRKKLNQRMYEEGTNSFFDPEAAKARQAKLIKEGKHNLAGVTCRDKNGRVTQIPKEVYHNQIGDKNEWEYISINSKEGKKRKQGGSKAISHIFPLTKEFINNE